MQELIVVNQIVIGSEEVSAVSARELHEELKVGRDFSNWIKDRIEKYDFLEATDYELAKFGEPELLGLQGRVDYFITLDMAKELSMIENNEQGKAARRYFIARDKELSALHQAQALNALRLEHSAEIEELRDMAEKAIREDTAHRERMGIALYKGLTSRERSTIYRMIDDIAAITESREATTNAVSSHLDRRYMPKGWAGPLQIPYDDAVEYLGRVKVAYEKGYRPKYKGAVVVDPYMINL